MKHIKISRMQTALKNIISALDDIDPDDPFVLDDASTDLAGLSSKAEDLYYELVNAST